MALVIFNVKYTFTQYFAEFIVYLTVRYTGEYDILSSQYILTFEPSREMYFSEKL